MASQAVERAKASSALENAAFRLVTLCDTIQAAGGLGTIEIVAGPVAVIIFQGWTKLLMGSWTCDLHSLSDARF